jgi:hypothetical protein
MIPQLYKMTDTFSWPEKVAYVAYRMQQLGLSEVDCPVTHSFADDGTYIREIVVPAGTVFVGRPHRHGHELERVEGSIVVFTQDGPVQLDAPCRWKTGPCAQVVAYSLTQHRTRTYHPNPTNSRDTEFLENEAFRPKEEVTMIGAAVERRLQALEDHS